MTIETTKESNATLIKVSGRIDAVTTLQFETVVKELFSAGETVFVLDFGHVDYISSAGLRSLLATAKLLTRKDGQFHLINVSDTVAKILGISGLSSIFQTHDSRSTALAHLS